MQATGLSATYRRDFYKDIARLLLLVVLGIEAIFLSDKLLTDLLLAALDYGTGPGFLLGTVALAMPSILLTGLPLALWGAVFLVLLQRREAGHFVVLAAVGLSPSGLLRHCLALGLGGFGLALLVAGLVAPLADYRLGQVMYQARHTVLTTADPGLRNVIHFNGATVLFHRLPAQDATSARVFLHLPLAGGKLQVITARDSHLRFEPPDGAGRLMLTDAQVMTFDTQAPPGVALDYALDAGQMVYRAERFSVRPYPERASRIATLTPPELLALPGGAERPARRAAVQMLLKAWLSALAPLLAAGAMGLTRGGLVALAGPAAVGAILGAGFAIAPLSGWLAGFGLWQALGLAMGGGLLGLAVLARALIWLGDRLMTPAGVRI